jgi:hypothetical protein
MHISRPIKFGIKTFVIGLTLMGCQKTCVKCDCTKNNVITQEEYCEYTNDKDGALVQFKMRLIKEKGYDKCDCSY